MDRSNFQAETNYININVYLHFLLLIIFISFILIIRKYFLREKPINIFILIVISCILRCISVGFKYIFVDYYIYMCIFCVLLLILIFIYLIYTYIYKKKQFTGIFWIRIHNSLIILTFWIFISLVSIFFHYNLFVLNFLALYMAINDINNEITCYLTRLYHNSISYRLSNIKNFICNMYMAYNHKSYIRSNRSFVTDCIRDRHYITPRRNTYPAHLTIKNKLKIEHVDPKFKIQAECDTSKNYVIKIVNNSLISIKNIFINNVIVSPHNLAGGEKPNIFAEYGGADNPLFVHKDIYDIFTHNNANNNPNDYLGLTPTNPLPLDISKLINNEFNDNLTKSFLERVSNRKNSLKLIQRISNNYPALIDYTKMLWSQKDPNIILSLNNRLITVNRENDELKKIFFYRCFKSVYEPTNILAEHDTSSLDDMVKWAYFQWIQYSRELNTLDKVMSCHINKDIRKLSYYNNWLENQIDHFMYEDLIELSKNNPEFKNIKYILWSHHRNMFNTYNFTEELVENRAYVRLQLLFYTIFLEEVKVNINNYNWDELRDNVLTKYHNKMLKTRDLTTFARINERRYNDLLWYGIWIQGKEGINRISSKSYPMINTILNHRKDLTPGDIGLTLTSKNFYPVLWGNSAKMEYIIKRKLS